MYCVKLEEYTETRRGVGLAVKQELQHTDAHVHELRAGEAAEQRVADFVGHFLFRELALGGADVPDGARLPIPRGIDAWIAACLEGMGMSVGDIIKMQAFLVAPDGGKLDFDGFMAGYSKYFGTKEQPNLPVRSAMAVQALVNPGWLVELEVTVST